MRVSWRLKYTQYWSKTYVRALHDIAPLRLRFGTKNIAQILGQLGPRPLVHLWSILPFVSQLFQLAPHKTAVLSILYRYISHPWSHMYRKSAPAVQHIGASVLTESPTSRHRVEHRHQASRSVNHRCIDHLPFPRFLGFQPHNHTKGRSIPPPPKSPTRFNGGTGFSPFLPIACKAPASAM